MGSVKLVTLLFLSYLFTTNGKAISKRYATHLLREGYTSDWDESGPHYAPSPLPSIIAARAELSPISIRYAEPIIETIPERTPSAAYGYEFTVPVPPTPLTMIETGRADDCSQSAPIDCSHSTPIDCSHSAPIAEAYPTPAELPAPATAITTDCNDIPTLPLAPPPPPPSAPEYSIASLPSPPPEELPPTYGSNLPPTYESGDIITEPSKVEDYGIEVAAAPVFDALPAAPQPIEMPSPLPASFEAPAEMPSPLPASFEAPAALPEYDEGCHGTTYTAPFAYGEPQPELEEPLPQILERYQGKALAGIRYGMPQLDLTRMMENQKWDELPRRMMMKRRPVLIRTGISHPAVLSAEQWNQQRGGIQGRFSLPHHDFLRLHLDSPKGEWHLPSMYRTGVSHPFLGATKGDLPSMYGTGVSHPFLGATKGEWHLPSMYRTGVSHPFLGATKGEWNLPLMYKTGVSHPFLGATKGEWNLPSMYRTGVSHPFLEAKSK